MISEITQSDDIALQLGISTHTVNNHLKNIFEKTKSKSKTDVLAKFFRFSTQLMMNSQAPAPLQRPVQILFLAVTPTRGAEVAGELQKLGANTIWSSDTQVESDLALLGVDWVVKPLESIRDLGVDELVSLRRSHNLCIQLNKKQNELSLDMRQNPLAPELFALGCVGILDLDQPASELAAEIAKTIQGYSHTTIEMGLQRVGKQVKPTHQLGPLTIQRECLGSHGFYLSLNDIGKNKLSWQVGDLVSIALSLPEISGDPILLKAQIAWRRLGNDLGRLPGLGFWIESFATVEDRTRYFQAAFEFNVLWAIPPATDQFEIADEQRKQLRFPAGA
jgi:hypothetical protein